MVYLGKISYNLYIMQMPIMYVVVEGLKNNSIPTNPLIITPVFLIAALMLAAAAYHFIEHPVHVYFSKKIKQRYGKKQEAKVLVTENEPAL